MCAVNMRYVELPSLSEVRLEKEVSRMRSIGINLTITVIITVVLSFDEIKTGIEIGYLIHRDILLDRCCNDFS